MLSYVDAFKWVYTRLPGHRKKQFWILFAGMTTVAFLETVALGTVAFFASTVTDPRVVLDSRYVTAAKDLLSTMALPTGFLVTPKGLILTTGLAMLGMITFKNSLKAVVEYWMARFAVPGCSRGFCGDPINGTSPATPPTWSMRFPGGSI